MDQIGTTLDLIRNKLNQFISNTYAQQREWVILSNVMQADANVYENATNKMVMFLANIQHETIISTFNKNRPISNDSYVVVAPPIYINLYLLLYANFSDGHYRDGLAMISDTIAFFQQNSYFTQSSLPGLDPVINKLAVEMVNLDLHEVNYLLGMMGAKCLPSVYYKLRLIPYDSDDMQAQTGGVQGVQTTGNPQAEKSDLDDDV
jgi:hypothetical protein